MKMKSILAVVAGIIFVIAVTTVIDVALHLTHVYPPIPRPLDDRLAALATSYRVVISIAGTWLTAWLAPDKPVMHAIVLCGIGIILGTVGLVVTWNAGLGPRWYPIALVVLAIPQCWAGVKIYQTFSRER